MIQKKGRTLPTQTSVELPEKHHIQFDTPNQLDTDIDIDTQIHFILFPYPLVSESNYLLHLTFILACYTTFFHTINFQKAYLLFSKLHKASFKGKLFTEGIMKKVFKNKFIF